ncbi:hypothetical protein AMJ80_10610 [bacterium SM23_31]|nr:MAG: hypothetical protein AMJ80_10610 [bacterium SM23_31]
MKFMKNVKNFSTAVRRSAYYNTKVIFSGKFIYFLIATLAVYIFLTGIYLTNADAYLSEANIFWLLFIPGMLIVFYPITFGIQNDVDNRTLELIFGIPNYRYKVQLVRLILIFFFTFIILTLIGLFTSFALTAVPITQMVPHLIIPIVFFGCLSFAVSTIIRDGNGTAVVILIIGIIFWIGREMFQEFPQFDIFINPFDMPINFSETAWEKTVADNRLYLCAGTIIAVLFGLLNLQKREKFLS